MIDLEAKAEELLTRERLSVKHNKKWLAAALREVAEGAATLCDMADIDTVDTNTRITARHLATAIRRTYGLTGEEG